MTPQIPLLPRSVDGYDAVVASPHHLSTAAGISVLCQGGNAVDAAIAVNAVQGVVAPETCGIGGDLFALVTGHGPTEVVALNASGRAGSGASRLADELRRSNVGEIPQRHPAAVSIPGCVDGWLALHGRFGRLDLGRVLGPAIRLGREGFPASQELSLAFGRRETELRREASGRDMYPGGRIPRPGDRIRRADLAATLEAIAGSGRAAVYEGVVGKMLCEAVEGSITPDDLTLDQAEWVEPLSVDVLGHTVWTVPPNSQGYIALLTLAVLERMGITSPDDPVFWHRSIESYRQAAADRDTVLADPDAMSVRPEDLIDPERVEAMADRVDDSVVGAWEPPVAASGGTAYMCVVDGGGMAVSLIQSNFYGIGSGISVPGAGFLLHDRARGFTLTEGHPNQLAPGRRPLHTLSPVLWTRDGEATGVAGTRGGHIQPQLVAQLCAHLLGQNLSPGEALAVPRWSVTVPADRLRPPQVRVEPGAPEGVVRGLEARGHDVEPLDVPQSGWGPMSAIVIDSDGRRVGGADPRVATAQAAAR